MISNRPPKPKRWVIITDGAAQLGTNLLESVRELAEKHAAIKISDGLTWINVARIKREAAKVLSLRKGKPGAPTRVYKFEMHVGRLRYSSQVQLPGMMMDLRGAIKDANAVLGDPMAFPYQKRKAISDLVRLESQLPCIEQRIEDTIAEIARLERLDDNEVVEWYAARGWTMPAQSLKYNTTE